MFRLGRQSGVGGSRLVLHHFTLHFLPQWGCDLPQCGLPTASRWDGLEARLPSPPARGHLRVLHGGVDVVLPRRGCQRRVSEAALSDCEGSSLPSGLALTQHFVCGREECSENNVSTTKYPCVKSSGEAATCYRWSVAVVTCGASSVGEGALV